jgi:hypothetical protein
MTGFGVLLIVLGVGSLLLPMLNLQFRLMEFVDPTSLGRDPRRRDRGGPRRIRTAAVPCSRGAGSWHCRSPDGQLRCAGSGSPRSPRGASGSTTRGDRRR